MTRLAQQSAGQWRRDTRAALMAKRMAVTPPDRKRWDAVIEPRLYSILIASGAPVIGLYWPFKGEFNSRCLMQRLFTDGRCVALPDVVEAKAPLAFRPWQPDAKMMRGVYGIPVPQTPDTVTPDAVVAPLVGFDRAGYRLGHGGGYYDRTLAALAPTPLVVGVGYEISRIETIHPRPHDVAMNVIVTEAGAFKTHSPVQPKNAPSPTRQRMVP